jgi:hypothetical protein
VSLSDVNPVIPGCRESEENDSSLFVVLDSLIPFIRDQKSTVPLPVYMGNSVFDDSNGGGGNLLQVIICNQRI